MISVPTRRHTTMNDVRVIFLQLGGGVCRDKNDALKGDRAYGMNVKGENWLGKGGSQVSRTS